MDIYQLKENVKNRGTLLFPFELYNVNRKNEFSNLISAYHWHDETEIIYAVKGEFSLKRNGQNYLIKQGDVAFINSGDLHEYSSISNEVCYKAYLIPFEYLNFEIYDYSQSNYIRKINNKELRFPAILDPNSATLSDIRKEVKEIININESRSKGYELQSKACIYKILSYLINNDLIVTSADQLQNSGHEKLKIRKQILIYIQDHYNENLYLDTISSVFHMAPKYFCRFFKKSFDKTFIEYLNYFRIEKACQLLRSSDKMIIDVAFLVGFENFSYFIRTFKRHLGVTPNVFRKKCNLII